MLKIYRRDLLQLCNTVCNICHTVHFHTVLLINWQSIKYQTQAHVYIISNQIITAPCTVYCIIKLILVKTVFLPLNNKACISNTDSCAHERCFTQVRIFLTFFLVGSVGFIKKNCFLIRQPGKKKRKQKFILGSQVGVGGRRDLNLIGLGKGYGVFAPQK